MIVLGVDPGSVDTGIVFVDGEDLIAWNTVSRDRKGGDPIEPYIEQVCEAVKSIAERLPVDLVGLEECNRPNPHVRMTNPIYQMETKQVIGAVQQLAVTLGLSLVMVPPKGNGSHPLGFYPVPLRGVKGQRGNGVGAHVHERSAWDIARLAPTYYSIQQAESTLK